MESSNLCINIIFSIIFYLYDIIDGNECAFIISFMLLYILPRYVYICINICASIDTNG